jgi:hypothetical protein
MIYDQGDEDACSMFFFEASLLEKMNLWCCIDGVWFAARRN